MTRKFRTLDHSERYNIGVALRRFIRHNPHLEDTTGWSEGYYNRLIDDFIRDGTPPPGQDRQNLLELIAIASDTA